MKSGEKGSGLEQRLVISRPNLRILELDLEGDSPYVMHKFSEKARKEIEAKQTSGSKSKKGEKRKPRDIDQEYQDAFHRSRDGWVGIHAGSFRNAAISASRIIGFKMTLTKLAIFVVADGYDADDGVPLVKIIGKPRKHETYCRPQRGVTTTVHRPMWESWSCKLRVRYDADMFSEADVVNLFMRVGLQVGIGEGRNDSPNSGGMGWGSFTIKNQVKASAAA